MGNEDNIFVPPIDQIKKVLVTKKINGKDYYYLKIKSDKQTGPYAIPKEIYVCNTQCSDEELRYHFCLARMKLLRAIFDFLYKRSKKNYPSKYLTDIERRTLEILRFGYQILLKEYSKSDQEKYEQAVYTKYVYGTTSIEGNTYTLRETDLTLNEGLTVGGKETRELYEIENYGKMKEYLSKLKRIKIDITFIKKIHQILIDRIDQSAGSFRNLDVGIRGTTFEPVPAVLVEHEMDGLVKWYNRNKNKLHPIELAAVFHQKFEEIHPFLDGNGRVGRELMRIILYTNGYPTIFIDKTNREEYLKCLDEGNEGNHKPIIKFVITNLCGVHDTLLEEAKQTLKLDQKTVEKRCAACMNKEKCQTITRWGKESRKHSKRK